MGFFFLINYVNYLFVLIDSVLSVCLSGLVFPQHAGQDGSFCLSKFISKALQICFYWKVSYLSKGPWNFLTWGMIWQGACSQQNLQFSQLSFSRFVLQLVALPNHSCAESLNKDTEANADSWSVLTVWSSLKKIVQTCSRSPAGKVNQFRSDLISDSESSPICWILRFWNVLICLSVFLLEEGQITISWSQWPQTASVSKRLTLEMIEIIPKRKWALNAMIFF